MKLSLWGQAPVTFKTFTEIEAAYNEFVATVQEETCLEIRGHGHKITTLIGADATFIQLEPDSEGGPYEIVIGDHNAIGTHEFYPNGHHTEMDSRYVLSPTEAHRVVLPFIKFGAKPSGVTWETV